MASQANKLRNGLSKIDDTRVKVNEMAAELEVTQEQVHKSTRECEEFLVTIGTRHPLTLMYRHWVQLDRSAESFRELDPRLVTYELTGY